MKIAFSTLGCPNFDWSEIYSMAKDLRFNGFEVRGLGNNIFSAKGNPFSDTQLPKTLEKLNSLRLEIPCLSSGCSLKYTDKKEENHTELVKYIKLAESSHTVCAYPGR